MSGNAGGTCYIGPRAGGSLFEDIFLRADVTVSGALSEFRIFRHSSSNSRRAGDFDTHSLKDQELTTSIEEQSRSMQVTTTIDLDEDSGMTDGTWEALNTNSWSIFSSGNAVTWDLDGKTLTINGPEGAQCNWMVMATT